MSDRPDPCDVEAARRVFDAYPALRDAPERRERIAREVWTEDVVYREDPLWPGAASFHGREAVLSRFAEYEDLMSEQEIEPVEFAAGTDAVLALFDFTATADASRAPIRQRWAYVLWTRDGKVREFHAHLDVDEARRKAGA